MGKSAPEAPPIPIDYGEEEGLQEDMMSQLMQAMAMMSMMGSGGAVPQVPPTPTIATSPEIDWSDKQEKIASKMKADFHVKELQRHGRAQSIHTSPLLDEAAPETTESILTGS